MLHRGGGAKPKSGGVKCQGRVQDFSLGVKTEGPTAEAGFLGREQQPPPHQLAAGSGGAPTAQRFSTIFSIQDSLS